MMQVPCVIITLENERAILFLLWDMIGAAFSSFDPTHKYEVKQLAVLLSVPLK